jgi:hypothetical protein
VHNQQTISLYSSLFIAGESFSKPTNIKNKPKVTASTLMTNDAMFPN